MFDADHFKRVNDNFGHAVGDMVLIRLVQLCQQQLRPTDRLIRWGGEEFLLLIGRADATQLGELAERLRKAVADHDWAAIEPGLEVTISLGYLPARSTFPCTKRCAAPMWRSIRPRPTAATAAKDGRVTPPDSRSKLTPQPLFGGLSCHVNPA